MRLHLFALATALGLVPACAVRSALDDRDVRRALEVEMIDHLRVYVSHKTVAVYELAEKDVCSSRTPVKKVVKVLPKDAGQIVDQDVVGGRHRLWVSFSPRCDDPICANGFLQGDDGRYHLQEYPELGGYESALYFGHVGYRQRMRKRASSQEAYRLWGRGERLRTVYLEVKRQRVLHLDAKEQRHRDRPASSRR